MANTKISEAFIQKALWHKYLHHKYRFLNMYYFTSEQDYLTFLDNGYCWEIEIKRSRSDFKADFKKRKHKEYSALANGNILRAYRVRDVYEIVDEEFDTNNPLHRPRYSRPSRGLEMVVQTSMHVKTNIEFRATAKTRAPNRFYYAAPQGLLKAEDMPWYAGLLEVDDRGKIKTIVKAPLIHKGKHDPKRAFNTIYNKYHNVQYSYLQKITSKKNRPLPKTIQ